MPSVLERAVRMVEEVAADTRCQYCMENKLKGFPCDNCEEGDSSNVEVREITFTSGRTQEIV